MASLWMALNFSTKTLPASCSENEEVNQVAASSYLVLLILSMRELLLTAIQIRDEVRVYWVSTCERACGSMALRY